MEAAGAEIGRLLADFRSGSALPADAFGNLKESRRTSASYVGTRKNVLDQLPQIIGLFADTGCGLRAAARECEEADALSAAAREVGKPR
jgi:hypothetical protein